MAEPDRRGSRIVARGDRPTWSPDSRFFAYASGRAIVIADANGARARRLEIPPGPGCPPDICVHSELNAQWSPAGTAILFKHSTVWHASKGSSSLWTVEPDGANLWRVPSEFTAGHAAWSPTGSQIAFVQFDQFEDEALRIADTGGTAGPKLASAWGFVWSPRGDMIVALGGRDATYAELVRVRDGWGRRLGRVHETSWSPDGRRIAFARGGGIWIADRLGNQQRRVATGVSPSWSPRGDTIAFAAAACGPRQGIWLLRVATGAARRVTRGCAVVR